MDEFEFKWKMLLVLPFRTAIYVMQILQITKNECSKRSGCDHGFI